MADIEIKHCMLNIEKLRKELLPFEKRFQMTSAEAWEKYNNGLLGDDIDIMEWMGLYESCLAHEAMGQRSPVLY